jgi:hypothetical protein
MDIRQRFLFFWKNKNKNKITLSKLMKKWITLLPQSSKDICSGWLPRYSAKRHLA